MTFLQMTKALPPVNLQADVNRTITERTVTERRTSNTQPKYHTQIERMMTPPPRSVDLDITLPQELTAEERTLRREEERHETQISGRSPREFIFRIRMKK